MKHRHTRQHQRLKPASRSRRPEVDKTAGEQPSSGVAKVKKSSMHHMKAEGGRTKHRLDKFKRGGRSRSRKADQAAASSLKLANGGPAGLSVNVLGGAPGSPSIPQISMIHGSGPPLPGKLPTQQQNSLLGNLANIGKVSEGANTIGSGLGVLGGMIGPGGSAASDYGGMGGWGMAMPSPGIGQARGGRAFADGGVARTSAKRRIAKT